MTGITGWFNERFMNQMIRFCYYYIHIAYIHHQWIPSLELFINSCIHFFIQYLFSDLFIYLPLTKFLIALSINLSNSHLFICLKVHKIVLNHSLIHYRIYLVIYYFHSIIIWSFIDSFVSLSIIHVINVMIWLFIFLFLWPAFII